MSDSAGRSSLTFGVIAAITAVALAVALWGGLSWTSQHREHREQRDAAASHQQEDVREQVHAQCVGAPRSRSFSCTLDAPTTPNDEQYAIQDLRAQQEMSEWAFAMFVTAVVGACITLAGVIYVAMTLVAHHTQVGYQLRIVGDPVAAIARRSLFETEAQYRVENRFCSFS